MLAQTSKRQTEIAASGLRLFIRTVRALFGEDDSLLVYAHWSNDDELLRV